MAAQRNVSARASASAAAPARPGLSAPVRSPTSPPTPPRSLADAQDWPAPDAPTFSTPVNARRTVPINAAPPAATRRSPQVSPYVPPRAAVCRFGWSVPKDIARVLDARPVCLANDDQDPIFCQTPHELAAFGFGLEPIFGEDGQADFQFYGGLRARLVDVVISDATSMEQNLHDIVSVTQRGLQLVTNGNAAAWPLRNGDPHENFGGNWWTPTYYLATDCDAFLGTMTDVFGPVLISADDLTSVLTRMGTFKLAGEFAREITRERVERLRAELVDSHSIAKMARTLENATLMLEQHPQALLSSAPRSADATRLAAAAANYAQALHARELRAWQERAGDV